MTFADATASLLFVGDMHLGRSPSRIPDDIPFRRRELGPEEAWRRTVALALEEDVAALVLAGDVVESLEDRFTADFVLSPGLKELQEAGIPVYAVVGNHDVHALPRLARLNDGLELLGQQGAWSGVTIQHRGKDVCRLVGWSFSRRRETGNPLDTLTDEDVSSDLPLLGVLHCDWGQNQSAYAPVPGTAFESGPAGKFAGWFLGHIHKPSLNNNTERPLGYLGSLAALDPGETGPHGPWLTILREGRIACRQIPLAPVRYDPLDMDVSPIDADNADDMRDALQRTFKEAARDYHENLDCGERTLRVCALRLHVHGRHEQPSLLTRVLRELHEAGELRMELAGTSLFVEALRNTMRPSLNVAEMARGQGPLAPLASFLEGEAPNESLAQELCHVIDDVTARGPWSELDSEQHPPPPEAAIIQDTAWELLGELHDHLRQQGGQS